MRAAEIDDEGAPFGTVAGDARIVRIVTGRLRGGSLTDWIKEEKREVFGRQPPGGI